MANTADVALVLAGAASSIVAGVATTILSHVLEHRKEKRARRRAALEEQLKTCTAALATYETFYDSPDIVCYGPNEHESKAIAETIEAAFGARFAEGAVEALLTPKAGAAGEHAAEIERRSRTAMRERIREIELELGIPRVELQPVPGAASKAAHG